MTVGVPIYKAITQHKHTLHPRVYPLPLPVPVPVRSLKGFKSRSRVNQPWHLAGVSGAQGHINVLNLDHHGNS